MAEKMTSINPSILTWCRESCGISIEDASIRFGADRIRKWENGEDYPTYSQLRQLCEYYRKPIAVCFFPEPPVLKSLPASFRTIPSSIQHRMFGREITELLDDARVMQLNLYELHDNQNARYALFSSMKFSSDIPVMAQQLRKVLNAELATQKSIKKASDHFEYWRDKFAEIGIFVFKEAFGNDDTSGFCIYDNTFPVIYINNSLSFTRQIFTLFHELCHIIHGTSGIDIINDQFYHANLSLQDLAIEKDCNSFAGVFLVPDDDFCQIIINQKPSEQCVAKLAALYGVSREVILRKFLDLKYITQSEYEERSAQYLDDYYRHKDNETDAQKESRGNYYNTQASYKGSRYIELVFKQYYTNKISLSQAAQYMNMRIPSLRIFAEKKGWGSL